MLNHLLVESLLLIEFFWQIFKKAGWYNFGKLTGGNTLSFIKMGMPTLFSELKVIDLSLIMKKKKERSATKLSY